MFESTLNEFRATTGEGIAAGTVIEIDGGSLLVQSVDTDRLYRCARLVNGSTSCVYAVGDTVILAPVTLPNCEAVILGRVLTEPSADSSQSLPGQSEPPDTLLIEAKEELTLRVGEGSITIRADGKILIKGKDLVSHAQRVNRIRGGSVAIN
jgi:hypothetical protein